MPDKVVWRPSVGILLAAYVAMSISGSLVAAMTLHLYVRPGFLGSLQAMAVWGLFSLLVSGLLLSLSFMRRYHAASIEQARMQEDLEVVREIQQSFTPELPTHSELELHTINLPSRTVSGDFVDVIRSDAGFLLAIADVEGKGIAAAVLMATIQASLRTQAQGASSIAAMVRAINRLLCRRGGVQRFASLVLARLEHDGARLTYCNAGHNPPLLFRRDGERLLLEEGGMLLGVSDATSYQEAHVDLRPGDRLVFYTDGIVEAVNDDGEEFHLARLGDLVASLPSRLGASAIAASIAGAVNDFVGRVELEDDRTLLLLNVPDLPVFRETPLPRRSECLLTAARELARSRSRTGRRFRHSPQQHPFEQTPVPPLGIVDIRPCASAADRLRDRATRSPPCESEMGELPALDNVCGRFGLRHATPKDHLCS